MYNLPADGPGSSPGVSFPGAESLIWLPAANAVPPVDLRLRARQEASLGDTLFSQGQFQQALPRYQDAVRLQPAEAGYHTKMGVCAWTVGRLREAEHHLLEAIRLAPESAEAHKLFGEFSSDAGRMEAALLHTARACELAPEDSEIAIARASILHSDGQSAAAWDVMRPLVEAGSISPRLAVLFGRVSSVLGLEEAALAQILRVLSIDGVGPGARVQLHFAAAKLLDGAGRYDEAFEHARTGKSLGRRPYDPLRVSQWVDSQISYFTPGKLHDLPRASHRSRRPVFIIGMPRSGTSLVEQILASHPQVHGAGELKILGEIAISSLQSDWSGGEMYPAYLDVLSLRKANELAGQYLSSISSLDSRARYVTDKMPQNFLRLGLITLLFPDCHIIHCTRDPLDTCLSCFMTYFSEGQDFSNDLQHLGAFYRDYQRHMAHWGTTLNVPMIEVNYERLVMDLERQTRRLLELLDLPWDDRCLKFYENKRAVLTASCDQVRRPAYASSIGRWKHYARYLGPLSSVLQATAVGF